MWDERDFSGLHFVALFDAQRELSETLNAILEERRNPANHCEEMKGQSAKRCGVELDCAMRQGQGRIWVIVWH